MASPKQHKQNKRAKCEAEQQSGQFGFIKRFASDFHFVPFGLICVCAWKSNAFYSILKLA
jgi:hypothetical protein